MRKERGEESEEGGEGRVWEDKRKRKEEKRKWEELKEKKDVEEKMKMFKYCNRSEEMK